MGGTAHLSSISFCPEIQSLSFVSFKFMTAHHIAMAPSPQQTFIGQGVLRISGYILMFIFWKFFIYNVLLYLFKIILLSGDIETHPGPNRPKYFNLLYSNIRGLHGNITDLSVASSKFDIICCSETLVSDMRHVSELLLPNFNKPLLLRRNALPRAQGMCIYTRVGFNACRFKKYECDCHEIMVVRVCSRFNNFYIFSLYRNPSSDDSIYDCLLNSFATIQEEDRKSCFIFIGDFNAHHRQWLNSVSPTDRHGVAALDFADVVGCDQLVCGATHRSGNCLDLLLTDVGGIVEVQSNAPIGSSDHHSLACKIQLDFPIPDFTITREVFIKSRINWDGIERAFSSIVWSDIYNAPCSITALNLILTDLINRFVPIKILRSRSHDKAWFNERCYQAYRDKHTAYNLWSANRTHLCWENYVTMRNLANAVYAEAESDYNAHMREVLSGASQPHKWWSTLKASLFGVESSIPPLLKSDGSVIYSPVEKANLLADSFNSKQNRDDIELPLTCHPMPCFTSFAFRSSEIQNLLSDLDEYGGTDPNGFFPLLFKKLSVQLAPKLGVIFRVLIRRETFSECWRFGNVSPFSKGSSPSASPNDYRPISITPVLSKVFERLLAKRLSSYLRPFLPETQFGFKKGLGTSDALLMLVHEMQSALDRSHECRLVSLDFSAAFDSVSHKGLIFKLQSVGVGGKVLNILSDFLTNRQQRVHVDGSFSTYSRVYSGVPQGSVLGPLLFILYTCDMWSSITNKMLAYADDTSLYAEIPSPAMRRAVADSLTEDLKKIQSWCSQWGMKLNPSKSKDLIVSRSRTNLPEHPNLFINGVVISTVDQLKLLGVTLDCKLTFELQLRIMSRTISSKLGILRKCKKVFETDDILRNCFFSFILPHFEYCSAVWLSAADSHLKLLDRSFNSVKFLLTDLDLDIGHRRDIGALSILYKIVNDSSHPLHKFLPNFHQPARATRMAVAQNSMAFEVGRCATNQFSRCFFNVICRLWNKLPTEIVISPTLNDFKRLANRFLLHNN